MLVISFCVVLKHFHIPESILFSASAHIFSLFFFSSCVISLLENDVVLSVKCTVCLSFFGSPLFSNPSTPLPLCVVLTLGLRAVVMPWPPSSHSCLLKISSPTHSLDWLTRSAASPIVKGWYFYKVGHALSPTRNRWWLIVWLVALVCFFSSQ